MRVFLTGHTGFKGAWLSMMLAREGHEVHGYALDPEPGALFETARVHELLASDVRADIRDEDSLTEAVRSVQPEVVLHLAAQPLVRESYRDPRGTMETNVMGTFNVLEALSASDSLRCSVLITTDKVYRNVNQRAGYVENDPLGGHDPYSSSKAMSDLLIQSWAASFPSAPMAIARAGNVIGGGDVAADRLLPDLLRGFSAGQPVEIRYPQAVRPWQHVLDCLQGYLDLTDALLEGRQTGGSWNFGPGPDSFRTVAEVADLAASLWESGAQWQDSSGDHPHEAELLALDATKARSELGWDDRLTYQDAVRWTVAWHRDVHAGRDARSVTEEQLAEYRLLDAHR